jgi:hypothetical protein
MKLAIKILNIISIVAFVLLMIYDIYGAVQSFIALGVVEPEVRKEILIGGFIDLFSAIFRLAPISLAVVINKKLDRVFSKSELLIWSILCLLFVNVISGVLMLIIPEDQVNPNFYKPSKFKFKKEKETVIKFEGKKSEPVDNSKEIEQQLANLKALYEKGGISLEEYEEVKNSLISKLKN